MFPRRVIVRRGPGLLGGVPLGRAAGPARGRRGAADRRIDELQRAADLKRAGGLTDAEFEREMRRILET